MNIGLTMEDCIDTGLDHGVNNISTVTSVVSGIPTVGGGPIGGHVGLPIGVQGVPVVVTSGTGAPGLPPPHEGLGSPPPAKMMRRGEGPRVELRFLIPSKIAGVVIGRGGQTIKQLREDYAARISIPDSSGPERVLTLEGELGTLVALLAEVLPKTEEANNHRGSGSNSGGPISPGMSAGSMAIGSNVYDIGGGGGGGGGGSGVDLRLLVHQSQIGCIIGRGGFNIRELREKLPLKLLKVFPAMCPASTDRVVQMVGPVEYVLQCVQKLTEMMESAPPKGPRNNYDARNFEEYSAPEYGGFHSNRADGGLGLIGRTGAAGSTPGIAGSSAMGPLNPGASVGGSMRSGPMGDFNAAGAIGSNPFGAGGQPGQAMPVAGGAPSLSPGSVVPAAEKTTTQVSLPDKLTGSIMGRGGARINQIRQQSGAEIKIDRQETSTGDRIITIRGSTEQIQKAQFLMQMCLTGFNS